MSGTLEVAAAQVTVVDPLADLPLPADDRTSMRTFPALIEQGRVTWTEVAPGKFAFHAYLPRRYGAVGATRHGLFANGAWYPQPVIDGNTLPELEWSVQVTGPSHVVMALGNSVGGEEVRWEGTAERASLAVIPHGVIEEVGDTGVYAVARRRVRKVLIRELDTLISEAVPEAHRGQAVVVQAPLRRRLARSGPGQALVSDRAFRVFPGMRRFHRVGVAREVLPALVPLSGPVEREWVGASWAEDYAEELSGTSASDLSRWARWLPSIDFLLNSRTMPFYGEILERRYVEDDLRDDLGEMYAPHYPGPAVVQLLDDVGGEPSRRAAMEVLLSGAALSEAIPAGEPGADLLAGWAEAVPRQDYQLHVDRSVAVLRDAPDDAPAEVVRIRVDGEEHLWLAGPGPDLWTLEANPRRVTIDPGAHLKQLTRVGDHWPPKFRLVGGGWIDNINLSDRWAVAALSATVRRSGDLRNSLTGTLATNQNDLARLRVAFAHRFGRQLDGVRRSHRVAISVTSGFHHPWYREDTGTHGNFGGGVSWGWSTRVASTFPLRGSYLSAGSSVGYAPQTGEQWAGFAMGGGTVLSWHPRFALALGGSLSGAAGTGEGRKRDLGGVGGVRGLDPTEAPEGPLRTVQRMQVRWAPIRQASVPVLLAWGSELQLAAGAEVAQLLERDQVTHGAGLVAGAYVIGEVLGFEPRGVGLTFGLPLYDGQRWVPLREATPTVYLRWGPNL
ncbi:MAG: hypothetical protein KC912_07365 [Proteobacteria bacterium]|nr:hypothetical protein [Pseudomonadota bacterium]